MKIPQSVTDLTAKNTLDSKFDFNKPVQGLDFNNEGITLDTIIESFSTTGFQSINLYKSIVEINKMIETKTPIYFGCTSNLISSGLRDIVRYLVEKKFVHVCVITAGGIEEDIIKCLKPTYCAKFNVKGSELRSNGLNRIGNLVIPNENYVLFEKWMNDVLDDLVKDQQITMTPSELIKYLGMKINNKESILYWAYVNNIPIYSPAITDGSIGDMLTFYKNRKNLKLDIVEDIKNINYSGLSMKRAGAIILGSGLIKHHILNANLFRNGLDSCVLVNTANEYDGSDAGASLEESISWGKVKSNTECVKVFGDATILFPLMVFSTFYKINK